MTDLTQLRIDSAKAVGKEIFTPPGHWPNHAKGDVVIRRRDRSLHVWAPDLEGHGEQIVELIAFLRKHYFIAELIEALKQEDWKRELMRAVAEVGDDVG